MSARNARRVAAKRARADRSLDQWLRAMNQQSGGVLEFEVIGPADFVQSLVAAAHGNPTAASLVRLVADAIQQLPDVPGGALCLCCPAAVELEQAPSFVVTRPANDAATRALASALCAQCAARPDVVELVLDGLRRIWPDARAIRITDHPAGRA